MRQQRYGQGVTLIILATSKKGRGYGNVNIDLVYARS